MAARECAFRRATVGTIPASSPRIEGYLAIACRHRSLFPALNHFHIQSVRPQLRLPCGTRPERTNSGRWARKCFSVAFVDSCRVIDQPDGATLRGLGRLPFGG